MKRIAIRAGLVGCLFVLPFSAGAGTDGATEKTAAFFPESFLSQVQRDIGLQHQVDAVWKRQSTPRSSVTAKGADEWAQADQVILGERVNAVSASSVEMIEATKAWREWGVKGEGMLISIVDTGINPHHPDLPEPKDKRAARKKSGSTQKVVPGYNWADRNQVTSDVGLSQHGMHVAGIAAANGKKKGVAPEAQLLSQKVFSNYHGEVSGLSESLLFAIHDSIVKKADVINLSLGTSAGYVDEHNLEQQAIKRAVDNGVIVVAAAGNDGYFGSDKVRAENPDVSMVGSPGLAPDALSVASVNATSLAGVSFAVKGVEGLERVVYMAGRTLAGQPANPLQSFSKPYPLAYAGKGKPEEYVADVKGKIVLLERGDISFDDKLRIARQAGAAGVIVYNNQPGPLIMSADETKQIPAVSILQPQGEAIARQLKQGKEVTVDFDGEFAENTLPFPNGGTISSFSSWGPTPDLQFKPEITAPGGGILSTVGEGEYAVKSGTSMATPHVAAGMALIKQAYRKLGRNLAGRELVETLKAAAMNTAEPIMDPREIATVSTGGPSQWHPYSPRVQGAGLLQIAKAIQTPAIVTDRHRHAGVSLGVVSQKTSFSLFVENKFGQQPITYNVKDEFGVLFDFRREGYNLLTSVPLEGATLTFQPAKVTVAPGSRQEVKVTLTLPDGAPRNIFSEGFVTFVPENESVPTLRVPFYGFYGDWNEPRVMDAPMWEETSQEKLTGVKTTWIHDKENDKWNYRDYLGVTGVDENGRVLVDPDRIAFSPNHDGHFDVAAPSVTFLRNARKVEIDVADSKGNVIRSLVNSEKVSKFDQSRLGLPYYVTEEKEWGWDGTAYSPEKGEYVKVPDGAYQFVIRAKVDSPSGKWQTLSLPVRVDTTPPRLHVSLDGNRLGWSSPDKDVQGYLLYVDGKKAGGPYSSTQTGTVIGHAAKRITLVAYDYAGNIAYQSVGGLSDKVPPRVEFPDDLFRQVLVSNSGDVPVQGRIAGEDLLDRVTFSINQRNVPVAKDGSFQSVLHLPEGVNYVAYSATDAFGNNRQFTQRIIVDTTAPQMLLLNDGSEQALYDRASRRAVLPLKFSYRDATFKGQVSLNGEILSSWEAEQLEIPVHKTFRHLAALEHGENKLLIEGRDEAGNTASITVLANVDTATGSVVLHHGEQKIAYQAKTAPALSVGMEKSSYAGTVGQPLVVSGKVVSPTPVHLWIYFADRRLPADVDEQGEFQVLVPIAREGGEKLTVVAVDALAREARAVAAVSGKKRG